VGGNHDPRGGDIGDLVLGLDPLGAKLLKHRFVVHQVAEDGERSRFGLAKGERDGVADSEAHTHVVGANNLHAEINFGWAAEGVVVFFTITLQYKVTDFNCRPLFKNFKNYFGLVC
jgi:hypothetical protein